METDISLTRAGAHLIIDTKYYRQTLRSRYGSDRRLHSEHLYQLFSYLRNVASAPDAPAIVEGMLLYPVVVLPAVRLGAEPVWHLFVIKVRDRERVRVKLQQQGVSTGVHYPLPLHRQPAYKHLAIPDGALPVTNRVATEILSLPMYPELSPDQIDGIGKVVIEALEP